MDYPGYGPGFGPGMMPPGHMGADGFGGMGNGSPGLFGSAYQGMGYGIPNYQMHSSMQQGQLQAGMLFSGGLGQFATQTLPTMAMGGMMLGSMAAGPLMVAGGQSAFTRGMGRALQMADPFSWIMGNPQAMTSIGKMGFGGMGWRMGSGLAGRLGGGMMARGAMGLMGGAALAAPPAMAAMAAMEAPMWMGRQAWGGATNAMAGQALMSQIGGSVAPGQMMGPGQGAAMGQTLHEVGSMLGTDTGTVAQYARELDQQKVFQTTKDAKEFREKFKKVMAAVKEIAQTTQGTVDDAMQSFAQLRQQGFYTTADITAQAASTRAREMATGLSSAELGAARSVGAQVARGYGMRGRYGARLTERETAGVAMGVRSGIMSEEEVEEMGGVGAVGARMAQHQMGFLGSARGTAIIAAMMGEGGAPDADRMRRFLQGGDTMESIVTGAAGRGLGVLRQAQSRESKEAFMPYAGMAMVQMAAAQQKQIYGGVSRKGILGMLGTMGVGTQEAELFLQQTLQMPDQLRREHQEASFSAQQAEYERRRRSESVGGRLGAASSRMAEPFRGFGGRLVQGLSTSYQRATEALVGGAVHEEGGTRAMREAAIRLARDPEGGGVDGGYASGGSLLGPMGARDKVREQYWGFTQEHTGPLDERKLRSGELINLGGGRVITRERLQQAERTGTRDLTDEQKAALESSTRRGDFMERMRAARGKVSGAMGMTGVMALDPFTRVGEAGRRHRQDFATFFGAQEAGLISKEASYEDYLKGNVVIGKVGEKGTVMSTAEERLKLGKAIGEEYRGAEGSQAERISSLAGEEGSSGNLATMSVEKFDEEIKKLSKELLGLGGVGYFSGRGALQDKLEKSGKVRDALTEFLGIISKPDYDAQKDGLAEKAARKRLDDAIGDDPAAQKAIETIIQKVRKNPFAARGIMKKSEQLRVMSGDRELKKSILEDMKGEGGRLRESLKGLKKGAVGQDVQAAAERLRAASEAGDISEREKAMQELTASVAADGKITDEEQKLLESVGARGGGGEFGRVLSDILGGDIKGATEKLEGVEGFDPAKLTEISKEKDPQKKAAMALEMLKGMGVSADTIVGTEGEKSIQGIQKEYIEANEKFVRLVAAFAAALGEAGVTIGEEGKSLGDAAGSLREAASGGT